MFLVPILWTFLVTVRVSWSQQMSACASAMKCVEEDYCNQDGYMSSEVVKLSEFQRFNRHPLTTCQTAQGTEGRCCRDYEDPWPSYKFLDQQSSATGSCGVTYTQKRKHNPDTNSHFGEVPWQVIVTTKVGPSCRGSIIGNNQVVTQASCVFNSQSQDIKVVAGEWILGQKNESYPTQFNQVVHTVISPDFEKDNLANNWAVLILESNFNFTVNVQALCLPPRDYKYDISKTSGDCISSGWARTDTLGTIMQVIDVNINENSECEKSANTNFNKFYANFNFRYDQNTVGCGKSYNDQCKVDPGSALACTGSNSAFSNQYLFYGLFSFDTGCDNPNQVGGYILPDIDLISKILAISSTQQLRTFPQNYQSALVSRQRQQAFISIKKDFVNVYKKQNGNHIIGNDNKN